MPRRLSPPPKADASPAQLQAWLDAAWRYVRPQIALTDDSADTIASNTTYHAVTALTAPRTLTLPSASEMLDGQEIVVQDESGSAGTHTITISRAGSDTINGGTSVTITSGFGRRRIIKRGAGTFFAA